MARPVIGTLTVASFVATATPGEYTFTGAVYNNQADATGNGAFDLAIGFLMFVPADDTLTFLPIPGVAHRFRLTAVSTVNGIDVDGTMIWDEGGPIIDAPSNGSVSIITQPSTIKKYGFLVSDLVYNQLPTGIPLSAYNIDTEFISDKDAFTEYHEITGPEAAAKAFTLQNAPFQNSGVIVDIVGGSSQEIDVDFEIVSGEFRWSGLNLDGILSSGDIVRLRYT